MPTSSWRIKQQDKHARLKRAADQGFTAKIVPTDRLDALLEAIIEPGDRICLEGDNQKQADFLARHLAALDPQRVHGLHLVISSLTLPEHLDLFERGVARRLDFSFSGQQSARLRMIGKGEIELGGIHTYLELYARYFLDLTPKLCFVAADAADSAGDLSRGQYCGHTGHHRSDRVPAGTGDRPGQLARGRTGPG